MDIPQIDLDLERLNPLNVCSQAPHSLPPTQVLYQD